MFCCCHSFLSNISSKCLSSQRYPLKLWSGCIIIALALLRFQFVICQWPPFKDLSLRLHPEEAILKRQNWWPKKPLRCNERVTIKNNRKLAKFIILHHGSYRNTMSSTAQWHTSDPMIATSACAVEILLSEIILPVHHLVELSIFRQLI